jgi:diacylglycerol kinase
MPKINRLQSFQYAFSGIWYTLKTQRNAQIHVAVALFIIVLGLFVKLNLTEWAILALTTGFVISMELLNTATESAMDYVASEFHPQVKVVKDVAAGGVLIAALTAVVVGLLILGPPLWEWLVP